MINIKSYKHVPSPNITCRGIAASVPILLIYKTFQNFIDKKLSRITSAY